MDKGVLDYHIIVESKNRVEADNIHKALLHFIKIKESVPYGLVERFLEILNDLEGFVDHKLDAESIEKATLAEQRLTAMKEYSFDSEVDGVFVSFKEILAQSIRGYLEMIKTEKATSKEVVIHFFFDAIHNVFKPRPSKQRLPGLSRYKKYVISAVLTEVCWDRLTNHARPTPAQLYEAVKHTLNKIRRP